MLKTRASRFYLVLATCILIGSMAQAYIHVPVYTLDNVEFFTVKDGAIPEYLFYSDLNRCDQNKYGLSKDRKSYLGGAKYKDVFMCNAAGLDEGEQFDAQHENFKIKVDEFIQQRRIKIARLYIEYIFYGVMAFLSIMTALSIFRWIFRGEH